MKGKLTQTKEPKIICLKKLRSRAGAKTARKTNETATQGLYAQAVATLTQKIHVPVRA